MKQTWWESGNWNVICDSCGRKFKGSELKLRWDGYYVCREDWEPRHPADFIRPIPDQQRLPWTRPEGTDVFINVCTVVTSQGAADIGTADCARADINQGIPLGIIYY